MRHLVDEAFLEERVLRVVDAAPDADRHMRVAHGEIDAVVRHVVGHVFQQALEKVPSTPNCMTRGETAAMIDWPEVRIFHAIGMPSASRPAVILALATGR